MPSTDAELVLAAQGGDVTALGTLLTRHRPAQLAVAYAVLGYGPDAEDAVQEAALVALRRIGDLRDPAAVAPWLKMVVRNACRMRLRAPADAALDDRLASVLPSTEPDPAELLDRQVARDWVWHALDRLSPALRLPVVLRHFTGVSSYRDIADVCGVPVGTVRSRLSEGRQQLAGALLETAEAAHDDAAALTAGRRQEAEELFALGRRGGLRDALAERWSPRVEATWPGGVRSTGYEFVAQGLEKDLAEGVRHQVADVVAGHDLTVVELDLVSPAWAPEHCPPGAVWVQQLVDGRVRRSALHHAARPAVALAA